MRSKILNINAIKYYRYSGKIFIRFHRKEVPQNIQKCYSYQQFRIYLCDQRGAKFNLPTLSD